MADINIDGIVTWLMNWFYDKDYVDNQLSGKVNSNQGTANKNLVTNSSGIVSLEDKPVVPTDISELTDSTGVIPTDVSDLTDTQDTAFTPKAHNQATTTILNSETYANLGSNLTNQKLINDAINSKIGDLSSIDFIIIDTTKPTASADTMGKLYIINENSKVNVYFTRQSGTGSGATYSWEKLDADILDELVVNWSDIQNKPSDFTPSSHTHGYISNDGKYNSNNIFTVDNQSYFLSIDSNKVIKAYDSLKGTSVIDNNAHSNINTSANANQGTINTAIDTALGGKGALTDDVDWSYNSNGFTNGVKLVSKTDNANGRITLHLKS